MKKDDLCATLGSLGLRFNNRGMNKTSMVNLIVKHMALMKEQASKKYDKQSKAKSSTDDEDLATDGHGSLMRKIEQADANVKGFRVFFIQNLLHVLTGVGIYQVADDDEEALDFLKSNNCLLLGKLDMEEEASDTASEDDAVEVLDVDDDDINIFDFIPESYLSDASDFSDDEASPLPSEGGGDVKPFVIKFVAPMTSKPILTLKLADTKIDIGTLKSKVVEKIASLPHSDKKKHLRVDDFVVMYDGSVLPDDVLFHYICDDDEPEITLTLLLRLRGGGGVKKSFLKKKASPTTVADAKLFEGCFELAKKATETENMNAKEILQKMDVATLTSLKEYIKHDKTTTAVKLTKVADYISEIKSIDLAIQKLTSAKEKISDMVAQSVVDECSGGRNFRIDAFTNLIEIQLELKKAQDTNMG
eukprot:Skav211413  [mRNA]  locus=scaffold1608:2366:3619:- [translate_table: standard]